MHPSLLPHLRCPQCHGPLSMPSVEQLHCASCARGFPIVDGAPRFTSDTTDTAEYFGYGWGLQADSVTPPSQPGSYHLRVMCRALGAPWPRGFTLDGGCGDGVDLANVALDPECNVVGVELSAGGVATSLARTRGLDRAQVIQGDLLRLPLASDTFDGAYSYGVVHHTPDPAGAVREIARTLKPGASLLLYVYEDFSDRAWYWRAALAIANSLRTVTTRLPPRALMAGCKVLSPIVYALCTLPSRHFSWAARFPYRHNTTAMSLVGDLYDRLAAPIEARYSRAGANALAEDAGLTVIAAAQERGWMVHARKPDRAR
ncbi:MAG: methyltransferase domain-containing protein [Vicinamibacterales bacterium]